MVRAPSCAQRAVEPVDHAVVDVERDRVRRPLRRDPRVPPVVRAQVPDERPRLPKDGGAHELLLGARVLVRVAARRPVLAPLRRAAVRLETPDELLQPLQICLDQLLREPGVTQLLPDVLRPVGVASLELRVECDVLEHASPQGVSATEERPRLRRVDPLEAPAQPGLERDGPVGLEQQRVEEQHAELAVAEPRLAGTGALERADVDEDRARSTPLDVVRRRVLEREARLERLARDPQLQERGVLQHRERPLVGVRHERQALVPQRRHPPAAGIGRADRLERGRRGRRRLDDVAGFHEPREQPALLERGPVRGALLGERADDLALDLEDPAVGVSERPAIRSRRATRRRTRRAQSP